MKEVCVTKDYNNMRIDRFLLRHFPEWSAIWIFKMIRLKKILLNNKKCRPSHHIFNGDKIQVDQAAIPNWDNKKTSVVIDEKVLTKINGNIDVLYEDDNIVIIKKATNVEVQSSINSGLQNLQNHFLKFLWLKGEYHVGGDYVPSICNRLDRNTSGLIMAAKNLPSQQALQAIIKNREVEKFYWCLVSNKPKDNEAVLRDYLTNDRLKCKASVSHIKNNVRAKEIITQYKVLQTDNDLTWLDVNLITGRTHQIRAHFAFYGFPIAGDRKYGDGKFKNVFPYQALHNYQIRFSLRNIDHILGYLNQKTFIWRDAWFLKKPYWNESLVYKNKK